MVRGIKHSLVDLYQAHFMVRVNETSLTEPFNSRSVASIQSSHHFQRLPYLQADTTKTSTKNYHNNYVWQGTRH